MTKNFGGYELQGFIAEYYDTAYNRRQPVDVDFYVDCSKKAGGHTLELSGIKIVELFGDFNKSAFANDSPEMIFIVGKSD